MKWTITIKDDQGDETKLESSDFMLVSVEEGNVSVGGVSNGGPIGPEEIAQKIRQISMVLANSNRPLYAVLGQTHLHAHDGWVAAVSDPEVG